VAKTHNTVEHEDTGKYRQLLVRTLHSCCIKFPDISETVIPVLTEFLSDTNELAAADVLVFVREAIQKFPNLRPLIIEKLLEAFPFIKSVKVHRAAIWILGEYATSVDDIRSVMAKVRQSLGEMPMVDDEIRKATGDGAEGDPAAQSTTPSAPSSTRLVTADGTYATQSIFSTAVSAAAKREDRPPLRK
jgi:coatomer subunit beta